tara:strand:+ start:5258 stop:5527 length:270 start_codon:yes stop_codon:yes gene_type:complete
MLLIAPFEHEGVTYSFTLHRYLTSSLVVLRNDTEGDVLPAERRVREIIDLDCPVDREYLKQWNDKINPNQDWYKMLRAQRMTGVGNLQG